METTQLRSVYTDSLDVTFNIYNFTAIVRILEDTPIEVGRIKMSPETAKLLHKILGDNIKSYEELYGHINIYTEEARQREIELDQKLKEYQQQIREEEMKRKGISQIPEKSKEKSSLSETELVEKIKESTNKKEKKEKK